MLSEWVACHGCAPTGQSAQAGHSLLECLQLRMSKKIAQLTKVIYHLNTKSEDHGFDMQDMADAYESEIEQMLRDAAGNINLFQSQLDAARDDSKFQEAVAAVQLRYEQERQVRGLPFLFLLCTTMVSIDSRTPSLQLNSSRLP